MRLRYLEEFTVLARCQSFSLAAEELFTTQATLSKHIQALEKELGVPLFARTTRSVQLSDFGRILLPFAQQTAAGYEAVTQQLKEEKESSRRRLHIVSIPVMAQYGITEPISAFRAAHPEVALSVSERESSQIGALLEKGEYELAFNRVAVDAGSEGDPLSPCEEIPYCTDRLVAVLPVRHPLSGERCISLTDLRDDPFLLMDENSHLYSLCIGACRSAGFEPRIVYKGHRPENLMEFVSQGMGVSLLMQRQAGFYKNPGIVTVPLAEPVSSRISLLYRRGRPLSAAARAFVEFLKEYLQRPPAKPAGRV